MLHNLLSSPNIKGMISYQEQLDGRYMWQGTPAEKRNAGRNLVEKPEGKSPLEIPGRKGEVNL